jgi:hypothetical protein
MMTVLTLEDMHDLPDPVDATLGVLRVAVPAAPAYAFNFGDDRGLRAFGQTAAHHMAKRNLDLATLGCMSYTPTGKARMVAILDCPILFPFAVASACRSVRSAEVVLTCAPSGRVPPLPAPRGPRNPRFRPERGPAKLERRCRGIRADWR